MADVHHFEFWKFYFFLSRAHSWNQSVHQDTNSSTSDDPWLRYSDKTIFNMAAVRHLEYAKFWLLARIHSCNQNLHLYTKVHQSQIVYGWVIAIKGLSKWRPSAMLDSMWGHHISPWNSILVPNTVLNFQVDWCSTFWYTRTFMFQHFGWKLPILGRNLTRK